MESMSGGTRDARSGIATTSRVSVFTHLLSNDEAVTRCAEGRLCFPRHQRGLCQSRLWCDRPGERAIGGLGDGVES